MKTFFNIKLFFYIKTFFSANNVYFEKNKYFFKTKKFFFQLSFATNEQPYSLRLLIPCAIISCDALTDFIGHYSKRDRHKYQDDEAEKERHELAFRIQQNI